MAESDAVRPASRIALVVEYDGTNYYGFQLQSTLPTVQLEIEKALEKLTAAKIRINAASRTDTGVHAKGQMVSFLTVSDFPLKVFVNGLNFHLPRDIAVKAAYRVKAEFDVRRNAVSREYRYYILNSATRSPLRERYSYRVAGNLDIGPMSKAAKMLLGIRDFASFASQLEDETRSTVREVSQADFERHEDLVIFNITANAFLPHQVRNTVGALLRIGLGRMSLDEFNSIIRAKKPGLAGPAASAHALFLMRVNYPRPIGEECE